MLSLQKYTKTFEMGFQTALEYRINFAVSLISVAYPIFIQTFLWTAIYQATTESVVNGYSYRQIIAYTFLAGLVTRMVRTGFEYEIMDDVKTGKFSKFLVQPLGYFPYRLCSFWGQKLPGLVMILAILVLVLLGLTMFWGVVLEISRILLFSLTLALAITLGFLIFYCISSMAFWLVEIGFLFEGIRIVIVLLSGGIFPLEALGTRFVQVTSYLPFKYTVSFPINVLTKKITSGEVAVGILAQCFWIGVCLVAANVLWRIGTRRYVAVGG